jgi:hypothetical protein
MITVARSRIVVPVVLLACAAIGACARERVEIADLEGEPAPTSQPPVFGPVDAAGPGIADAAVDAADGASNCSFAAPPITACSPCPTGYLLDDAGRPTCDCCE